MSLFISKKDRFGRQIKIRFLGVFFDLHLGLDYETVTTVGISSWASKNQRCVFLDYDNTKLEHLEEELKALQELYNLSDFYIFESSQKPHSYHAISLSKIGYKELLYLLEDSSCDELYKSFPIKTDYKTWILRVLEKGDSARPKYLKTVKSKYVGREKSLVHKILLERHYKFKIKDDENFDDNLVFYPMEYGTTNYVGKKIRKTFK